MMQYNVHMLHKYSFFTDAPFVHQIPGFRSKASPALLISTASFLLSGFYLITPAEVHCFSGLGFKAIDCLIHSKKKLFFSFVHVFSELLFRLCFKL